MSDIEQLLQQRYYRSGESKWEDVASRVAQFLYPDNTLAGEKLYQAIANKELLPSSPTLMNAGTRHPMLASCFVIPVEDSIESIMKALTDTVFIQKYGGGVGLNFSAIRAEGSRIKTTGGTASGPVSFMGFWNEAMNVIRQGGRRQGAMMGVLNVGHPDLGLFLNAKTIEGQLTNFNLSVGLDAQFFERLKLVPNEQPEYLSGFTPKGALRRIAQHAWENGEPGVLFLDNINKNNPYGIPITATNPCGEVPLPPYGVCCLGSINLNAVLIEESRGWVLDWGKLRRLIRLGVRMLDRVLTYSWWPIPEVAEFQKEHRPLGLGVMGLADMLVKLNRPYGHKTGRAFVDYLFGFIREQADEEADELAEKRGGHRSRVVLSIAPTGSIAMLAGASYSIEPYFALTFTKDVEAGRFLTRVSTLQAVLNKRQIPLRRWNARVIEQTGSVQETSLPISIKSLFRTANELYPIEHLQMQSVIQKHVDSAVSKTINLPTDITPKEIEETIVMAHELGLKGLTVYRNRSREVEAIICPMGGACDD